MKNGDPVARTRENSAAECPTAYSSTSHAASSASNSTPASRKRAVRESHTG